MHFIFQSFRSSLLIENQLCENLHYNNIIGDFAEKKTKILINIYTISYEICVSLFYYSPKHCQLVNNTPRYVQL